MKYFLITICLIFNLNLYSQEKIDIITFKTNEKLIKKIVISEKKTKQKIIMLFLLKIKQQENMQVVNGIHCYQMMK